MVLWLVGLFGALLTAFYMFRLVVLTFEGTPRFSTKKDGHEHLPHEAPKSMTIPLIVLAILSVVGGLIGIPHWSGIEHWLDPVFAPAQEKLLLSERGFDWVEILLMIVSVAVAVAGIWAARKIYLERIDLAESFKKKYQALYGLLLNKYKIDELYDAAVVNPILKGSEKILWKGIDVNVIDGVVNGAARVINYFSQTFRKVQTGVVQFYAVIFVGGIVAVLAWILFHS